jgi:hypothetical protein
MAIAIGEWKLRNWSLNDVPALARYANNGNICINRGISFHTLVPKRMLRGGFAQMMVRVN